MQKVYYPLTQAQQRIWYTEQFFPGTSISNLSGLAKLKSEGGIDPQRLIEAICRVVRTNDSLRLRLELDESGEARQYVSADEAFDIDRFDFSETENMMAATERAQEEARKPMALYGSRLFQFALFTISSTECWLFAKVHHVISDGISLVLLGNQIVDNYLKLVQGNDEPPIEQPSYTEYIASETDYDKSERYQKDKSYWNAQFDSVPEFVSLKRNESHPARTDAVRLSKTVPSSLHSGIQAFCQETGISPLSLFLTIVNIYMYRVTGQRKVTLGTFMGNRTNAREKQMLGMFVSTIPMQARMEEHQEFLALARRNMKELVAVIRHQKYPYNVLVGDVREQHGNVSRLFGLSLEYQVMQWSRKEDLSMLIEPLFCGHEVNDVSIHVKDRWDTGTLTIDMDYRPDLFTGDEMEFFYCRMMTLLQDALACPDKPVAQLELVPEQEKQQLHKWHNESEVPYDKEMTLHGLFERQAAITPERTAVVYEEEQISYKELNERSNRLARVLRQKGVGPDTPVAIWMERSECAAAAMLGVLKAGGAYVPIDPGFPEERIRYIIENSGAKVVVTDKCAAEKFRLQTAEAVMFEEALASENDGSNLTAGACARNLAYIMYTSGTTGKPKGVMIEHRQVHHLLEGLRERVYAAYDTALHVALLAPFHFDASVQQIFAALTLGHTLFIVPRHCVSDGRALAEYYRTRRIDVTDGTPAHLKMLAVLENLHGVTVRRMLIGGEALPRATVRKLFDLFAAGGQALTITNVYGPTECCVDASAYDIGPDSLAASGASAYMPIGRPLGNNRFYIVDPQGNLQPIGVEGELCIAGDGVGRGYLNMSELTAEKFAADPFVPGQTLYRTGDLARWLPDGNAEFVGRIDDQVKIRGYRIELGEIESVLQQHAGIGKAVVAARPEAGTQEQGGWELCAYVVWKNPEHPVPVAQLREHLSRQLPEYMLPPYIVELEEIPLTSSGKVDRKALLRHEVTAVSGKEYAAPTNGTEVQLAQMWQDVLGAERIGIHDNFFELGGHSLKAMTLLSRVHKQCGVEVPLQVLFETPTVYAVAQYVTGAVGKAYAGIEPAQASEWYPLSPAQQRIYIVSQLEAVGIGYNMPAAALLEGNLDINRLEQAFRELIRRHEALRTSFAAVNGVPMQRVHDHVPFEITLIESGVASGESLFASFVRPFELSQAPIMRIGLVRLAEDKHMLLFDMHHLISDGVTIGILLSELARLYGGERLPELRLQYKDYAVWQAGQAAHNYRKEEQYWLTELGGELPVLQLFTDFPRPPVQSFEGDRASVVLNRALTEKLNRLAEDNRTTLYTVLLAAYYALLSRYTGQDDIVIGTPIAGRNHADLEGIAGMFVGTLAIRSAIDRHKTFAEYVQDVRSSVLGALEHQNYPFEWLADKLNLPRDLSRNPVFDTMFVLQNAYEEVPEIGGMRLSVHETNAHIAKFDLTLQAKEERDGIVIDMDYSIKLFRKDTIERMLGHYSNLLESIAESPELQLGDVNMLTERETRQLLTEFNPAATPYPKRETIVRLFEQQVQLAPERTALAYEGETVTYAELNARANQLARNLRSKGVRSGTVVAVLADRSMEMITGILAILKAGGAYVPIDPEHPGQRIKHFLTDSGASVLLTQIALAHLAQDLDFAGHYVLADDASLYQGTTSDLNIPIDPGQLANLTYTSGTTGTPKGNMVTHANILRTVKNANYLEVTNRDNVLVLSNYVFDAFMFDMFGALLNGAKLVLIPKHIVSDMSLLPQVIERERISILMITTALFNLLVDIRPESIAGIRKVLFGGERASVDHVRKALRTAGAGKLLHMYGPSESTVFATYYPVDEVAEDTAAIPIGRPVSNTSVYILDSFRQLQPIGAAGELCVGGDGLVLGYYNRPELTAEKFVANPFQAGKTMYRTGDLARWLPDGNIEFVGRIDHQLKIRGQRIELGEIEHQLLRHGAVREAVVAAVDSASGEKLLCAYVVADVPLSGSELREHAAKELPSYMLPSAFIQLEELPLTGNGKVDRRALPKPDVSSMSAADYVAARNETEAQLVNIWQEVLGIPQIGVHDHFFELGGHSLKAMAMLARIHQQMQVEVPLKALFQSPTVAALALTILGAETTSLLSITPAEQRDVYPVSSAQQRLYVLQQLEGAERSYNMPSVLRLQGSLRRERLEAAIRQLVQRHDALRTSFDLAEGRAVQTIRQGADVAFSYTEATERDAQRLIADFIRPFDLRQAPLFRAGLIRIDEDLHLLLIDMHHIISDGASVSVLMEELAKLYAGEALEPLRLQYKDYAVWQMSYLQSAAFREQEAYWLERFAGELPVLSLPADHVRPALQSFAGDRQSFTLDVSLTQLLRKLTQRTETTLYMVLLASYSAYLAKLSGQSDIVVGIPVAGRQHPDVARIMGMFVNTLPIRTYPHGDKSFAAYLQEVKQAALEAYECQNYPLEELVGKVGAQRDMSRNPLFDAVFGMNNANLQSLAMEGVRLEPYPFEHKSAKFDLTLTGAEDNDTIRFEMEYNTALFEADTIERWIAYFEQLLRHFASEPDVKLAEADMMTDAERRRVVVQFNDTKVDYPREKTIHELFEEQAERVPDRVAVVFREREMTYRELNGKANRLATALRARGVQPDSIAGIMVEQSVDMIVGILAILKAGAAYLPIDPDFPDDRVRYLLADSGAKLVLTQRQFAGRMHGLEQLYVDDPLPATAVSGNLAHAARPEHLAYVIYTSGSTGQPKGVMVEHRNVVRLVKNAGYIPFDETCRMAQTGAISFDASTFELFGALLHGGAVYPVPKSVLLNVAEFAQFLQRHRITTMWLTSPLFNQLAQEHAGMFEAVRHLIIGGDALAPRHVNQVKRACPGLTLWNGYGPTENTTFSTCFPIEKIYSEHIPIGKPIGNSTAYIVNPLNVPQPIGVPGELCVGGDGVARGYLNRPELTKEKFVDNPFAPGERMYRTGDLARWLPDGSIEFMGRIDRQVKVRGFRIELGEIESQLMQMDGVNEAVVVARQDESGQNGLCAYYIGERELPARELRAALARTLPGYMIPSYFVQLQKMPLTPNGKVDRKALPEPDAEAGREEYKAPRNDKEEMLCLVWQDVLGAKRVGTRDNFFSLGGDSIKAIQMAARLHKRGWKLEMKDLFQQPTIEQVSVYLQSIQGQQADQAPVEGEVPLTPIQRWFFERRFTDMHHWNQAVMLHAPSGFKPQLVERTLRLMIEHHDALRMTYSFEDGGVVQYNSGPAAAELLKLEVIRPEAAASELEQAMLLETERMQGSIDLSAGPLLRAALFQTGQGDHLLLVIHHLVVDGVSWRILLEDFAAGYIQADKGEAIELPDKSHSYREWAARLRQYANSKPFLKEIDYWNRLCHVAVAPLPKDRETGDWRMRHARTAQFTLTVSETEQLTTRVHSAYRTEMNDILLTALGLAIEEWTGHQQVLVNLEGHGREEIIADVNVSRTVGWFTTQYPVLLDMQHATDPAYQIKRVKEDLRHIPSKGIGFGLLRYMTQGEHKSALSLPAAPEISFNYLGQFAESAGAGLFERSPFSIGSSLSPETEKMHPIDIVGAIEGETLRMTISYNSLQYEERTMVRLSESFKAQLLRLIAHCLNQEGGELTPSDLGDNELTLEELDKLLEIF